LTNESLELLLRARLNLLFFCLGENHAPQSVGEEELLNAHSILIHEAKQDGERGGNVCAHHASILVRRVSPPKVEHCAHLYGLVVAVQRWDQDISVSSRPM
jgi:hypothetical protein